ncbi:MAG TPA: hypothetical protein VHD33_06750, partial [Legionellaceae bacterium]|nr:hypothetical protein [Legionellaceae bacterium]
MITAFNNKIAVVPIPPQATGLEIRNGVGYAKERTDLLETEVVFGDGNTIHEGDVVYLQADYLKHDWANKPHTVDGKKFVIVPVDTHVVLVKRKYASAIKSEPKQTTNSHDDL